MEGETPIWVTILGMMGTLILGLIGKGGIGEWMKAKAKASDDCERKCNVLMAAVKENNVVLRMMVSYMEDGIHKDNLILHIDANAKILDNVEQQDFNG